MTSGMTHTTWRKKTFDDKEMLRIAQTMAGAEAAISRKMDELKSVSTTIKADIAMQEGIVHKSAEQLRSGYEMKQVEAIVNYVDGKTQYIEPDTGEIIEEHPTTPDEQMKLSGKLVDAEDIIREDRQRLQDEDSEEE